MGLLDPNGRMTGGVTPMPNTNPATGGVYPQPWQGTQQAAGETNQNPFGFDFADPYGYRVMVNGNRMGRIYDWNGKEIDPSVNRRQTGSDGFTTLYDDNWNPVGFGFERQPGQGEDFWKDMRDRYMQEQPDNMKTWLTQMYGTDNPNADTQYVSSIGKKPIGIGVGGGLLSDWNPGKPATRTDPRTGGVYPNPNDSDPDAPPRGPSDPRGPRHPDGPEFGSGVVNLGVSGAPQGTQAFGSANDLLMARLAKIRGRR